MTAAKGYDRVQFGSPDRNKGPSTRSPRGRRCEWPDCETVLSTYNRSSMCWVHDKPGFGHALKP